MPTTQVYTWQQLLDAYAMQQGTAADPHVIEVMADLDGNDAPMTAGISSGTGTDGYHKTVNGNYHMISNINTSTIVNNILFNGRYVAWHKCNFVNMYRNESYAFFGGSSNTYRQDFYDCTLQGKGYSLASSGNFTRCVITWDSTRTSSVFKDSVFTTCYIDAHYHRDGSSNYDYDTLTNCFVKGVITPSSSSVTDGWHLARAMSNTMINIDTPLNYARGLIGTTTVGNVSVYNTGRLTGTISAQTNIIGVTDTQAKDNAYLASIGFNIIV